MEKRTKSAVVVVVNMCLGILAIGLLLGILNSCSTIREAPIITGMIPAPNLGVTICSENGLPVIIVKDGVPPSTFRELIITHEKVHVEQIHREGGCRRFMHHYRTSKSFRVQKELEAYCRANAFGVSLGLNKKALDIDLENVMKAYFDTTGVSCGRKHEATNLDYLP